MTDFITLLSYLTTFVLAGLVMYKLNEIINFHFHLKRCRGLRFVLVPAYLTFKQKIEDDEFSDPELNRLMGKKDKKYKYVNISYTLDLEMIKSYHEYTYDDGEDDKVMLNCTYVTFTEGSYVIINLPYSEFDDIVMNYNNTMYNLI